MNYLDDWNVCFEIGLNHLGACERVLGTIREIRLENIPCSVTVQIREEGFYQGDKEKFALNTEEYIRISSLCKELGIPFGLALGPLDRLDWLAVPGISPNFIKLIGKATNDGAFIDRLNSTFTCSKYYSVGMASSEYIEEQIIPRMRRDDMLVHTALSHESEDQNLGDIKALSSLGKEVCFGLHARNPEICFTAIGAGATKIFAYVGDKTLSLPDHDHAIGLDEVVDFYNGCWRSFSSMKKNNFALKPSKIKFIG